MPRPRRLLRNGTLLRTNLILHSAANIHTPNALQIKLYYYNIKTGENSKKNFKAVNAFKMINSKDMAANPITITLHGGIVTL